MDAKLFIVKLLIVAFIIGHHDVYSYTVDEEAFLQFFNYHMRKTRPKHPICFAPSVPDCKHSSSPERGYEVTRWTYNAPKKVCAPLFMIRNDTCKELYHLPLTLKECQDFCGDPCIIILANKTLYPGICTQRCRIHVYVLRGAPKPCPDSAKCCHKYFMYPTVSSSSFESHALTTKQP